MERPWWVMVPVVVPAVIGLVCGVLWLLLHGWIIWGWWSVVGDRELSAAQQTQLSQCVDASWWTLVKVMSQDLASPCGDPWVVEQLAARARLRDQRTWLEGWVDGPDVSPQQRTRAALALALQGKGSSRDASWLLLDPELPDDLRARVVQAVATNPEWAEALGPRWRALGALHGAELGTMGLLEVGPIVDGLRVVPDSAAHQLAGSAVGALLQVDDDLIADIRRRRELGRPVSGMDARRRQILVRNVGCEPHCLGMWAELLAAESDSLDWAEPPVARPARVGSIGPWVLGTGGTPEDAERVAWWAEWTATWTVTGPRPAARLASLLGGLAGSDREPGPMAVLWTASGTPWATAAMVLEVGERAGVPVEVGALDGQVWVSIDRQAYALDPCGRVSRPTGGSVEPWPMQAVVAQALAEDARARASEAPAEALRIARAAQRLDPVGAAGVLTTVQASGHDLGVDFATAFSVGASLTPPSTAPKGAEDARQASGASPVSTCEG